MKSVGLITSCTCVTTESLSRRTQTAPEKSVSTIKASRLASFENLRAHYDYELNGNLAEFCDKVNLA